MGEKENMDVDREIDRPPHYIGVNGIEAIDVVEGFGLNFHLASAVCYILRESRKGGLGDLKKARWYLDREISRRSRAPEEAHMNPEARLEANAFGKALLKMFGKLD